MRTVSGWCEGPIAAGSRRATSTTRSAMSPPSRSSPWPTPTRSCPPTSSPAWLRGSSPTRGAVSCRPATATTRTRRAPSALPWAQASTRTGAGTSRCATGTGSSCCSGTARSCGVPPGRASVASPRSSARTSRSRCASGTADVICYEDFPETMRAFRIRHMKWTRGTCEFLFREMGRALRSRRIPLVEKLDVLFPTLNLPLSLLYFLFILDANLILPALFGEARAMTLVAGGAPLTVPFTLLDARFLPVMTPDFYAITLLTLLAPVLCFILDMWRTPVRLLRFLGHSTAAYGTLGPLSSIGVLLYLITGKAVFHVTADRGDGTAVAASAPVLWRLRAAAAKLFAGSHPDHAAVQGLEILCGVVFAVICLETFQVSFFGLSLGFILLPVLHHKRWESPLLRALVYVPFAFIVLGIALGGLSLLGLSTVLFGYGFHF